jgi:ribosome-associated heat shock protein Hsp15
VQVNGAPAKAAREVRAGDTVDLRQGRVARSVVVRAVASTRGPAPVAQQLYEETAESLAVRALVAERQRLAPEPAAALHDGRPTKRERRAIDQARDWGERWSASWDES